MKCVPPDRSLKHVKILSIGEAEDLSPIVLKIKQ